MKAPFFPNRLEKSLAELVICALVPAQPLDFGRALLDGNKQQQRHRTHHTPVVCVLCAVCILAFASRVCVACCGGSDGGVLCKKTRKMGWWRGRGKDESKLSEERNLQRTAIGCA